MGRRGSAVLHVLKELVVRLLDGFAVGHGVEPVLALGGKQEPVAKVLETDLPQGTGGRQTLGVLVRFAPQLEDGIPQHRRMERVTIGGDRPF